ncbi:MAG: ROK family protein [Candidatus Atribacteria bacterium]|nr:ROK family protein [Candidatus Atribacteria bacterium]
MSVIVAIDIGGTQLRVAVYPRNGTTPITKQRTASRGMEDGVFERLTALIDTVWPKGPVDAISVAAPGPLNPYTGIITSTPNIPAWTNYPLAELLSKHYQVPAYLGNDANLAALGEWKYGAGQGHHDVLYLTLSTGIGGGVISSDMLIEGCSGMATELGHVTVLPGGPVCSCGVPGHLEAVASGPAIARYVSEQIADGRSSILRSRTELSARDVAEAAKQGDELAKEAFVRAGGFIGQAVAEFLHIFNPSIVIFGGGVSQSGRLILDPIEESMKRYIMDKSYLDGLQIATAKLGDDAGLLGALAQAHIRLIKAGKFTGGEIYGTA